MSTDTKSISKALKFSRVRFFEISAKVPESTESSKSNVNTDPLEPKKKLVEIQIRAQNGRREMGFRATLEFSDETLIARIDCAAFFRKLDLEMDYNSESVVEFLRSEAMPLLAPYIRETLADVSRRVTGKTLNLGLVHMDDLSLTDDS